MSETGNVDQALARYLSWYAACCGWTLADVAKKLERPHRPVTIGYAGHLLTGRRPISKKLRDPVSKTFAWGTRQGARTPVFILTLIDPETGAPQVLRGKDRRLGFFTNSQLAWQLGSMMQTAGVRHLTAIPAWPHMLGPDFFPTEPESQHLDAEAAGEDPDDAGYRISGDILGFVCEALDVRGEAISIHSPRGVTTKVT